jgi:hypothetical protein
VQELKALTAGMDANDYHWEVGSVKSNGSLIPITYLVGIPLECGGGLLELHKGSVTGTF